MLYNFEKKYLGPFSIPNSPFLFNAGLEVAIRRWKGRLLEHGLVLGGGRARLTNIRYADDLMIYAKSDNELIDMLEMLVQELSAV